MKLLIAGLSITSSWGNGHATTFRGLVRGLAARGHELLFLERDVPWYAENRDAPRPEGCRVALYRSVEEARVRFTEAVRGADAVILGSYVPEGVRIGEWILENARGVTAFYDIDTPVTLARLQAGDQTYLSAALVPGFDLYLSFTGGPILRELEGRFGARRALPLYCSADPHLYRPAPVALRWQLGYLGTYSDDRQLTLERLLLDVARRRDGAYVVGGPSYPADVGWPRNVERISHVSPGDHAAFYSAQRYTLNVTRADMIRAGHSPSVRLFEAAACGVPVISDVWEGMEAFFEPGREILLARTTEEVAYYLDEIPEDVRREVGARARRRVLDQHTAGRRAQELERYLLEARAAGRGSGRRTEARDVG